MKEVIKRIKEILDRDGNPSIMIGAIGAVIENYELINNH